MTDRSKTLDTNQISLRILGIVVTAQGVVGIGAVLLIAILVFAARYMALV